MAAHPLPFSGSPALKLEKKKPATSAFRAVRGLHLVTTLEAATLQDTPQKVDSLDQARRIVAQVEWEIQQQAARERAYRHNRWRSPIAVHAGVRASQQGFFSRLRHLAGL